MYPLLNVWKFFGKLGKSTGECKNHHSNKFSKFLKIFGNLRKSSEIVAKCLKQPFSIFDFFNFRKLLEVFGNLRKSSEEIGKCRKILKTIFRQYLKIFKNFWKSSEVFGNARKTSETLGKFSNVFGGLRKFL